MQKLYHLIQQIFNEHSLIYGVFSDPICQNSKDVITKVTIRPLKAHYQISSYRDHQVFHENLAKDACEARCYALITASFKQGILYTLNHDYHLLLKSQGKVTIYQQPPSKIRGSLEHNRQKKYLIPEGTPIPFLIALGMMNTQGKVFSQKMDKFRQMNHFLEIVLDTLPQFSKQGSLNIVDFGCGKSYLTFSMYYLLHVIKGFDIKMIGLDLKEDVIAQCQQLSKQLGYTELSFAVGNIGDYYPTEAVDLVVSLHACNTATDAALLKAVRWGAKVILSAPCCQHELSQQITSKPLDAILQYGILKERFAAITTDAARAKLLEMVGYHTQLLEFIDSEHTPKNLLIRATLGISEEKRKQAHLCYQALKNSLGISPTLERLLSPLGDLP